MSKKARSTTKKDSFFAERLVGASHHKTTISDGTRKATGRGNTARQSQRNASKAWSKVKGK